MIRPDPDPARDWIREELSGKEYQPSLLERVAGWFGDFLDGLIEAASGVGRLDPVVAFGLLALLLVGAAVVLARLRPAETRRAAPTALLGEERISAAGHRALARRARDEGRYDDAVVEAMRAIAVDLVDRAVLDDRPATTAREVAETAAAAFADLADRLHAAAERFDAVRYGDRHADRAAADELLALEDALRHARPDHAAVVGPALTVPR